MLFNTGYYPDQSEVSGLGTQDLPYIVLYNRFTGILRVFGSYGVSPIVNGGLSFDGLRITVKFSQPTKLSGNLRLRNGHDAALDQNTDVLLTQTMALHTNSPSQWFCADFQLAYDPCICFYPSKLRMKFDFYDSKEITLYGRSISIQDEIADGNHLLTNNFLSNFQNTSVDAQGNFATDDQIIMYKVMDDFIADYIERLEKYKSDLANVQEYNKEIERKLVIVKIFKKVVIDGTTYGVSSFIGQNWFQNAVDFADHFIPPLNADDSTVAVYRKKLEASAKKAIGAGVETFINKNFKKKKAK